jgi:hypothetical protein
LIRGQPQDAIGNRIAVVVIVKKPGVNIPLAERGLYGRKIHGQTTILNNGSVLSESCPELEPRRTQKYTKEIVGFSPSCTFVCFVV